MRDFKIKNGVLREYRGRAKDVTVPEGVKVITALAFRNCTSLRSVTLPAGLRRIDAGAFSGCKSVEEIRISAGCPFIAKDGILYTEDMKGLVSAFGTHRDITIPEGVSVIRELAFSHSRSLRSVTLLESVTEIGDGAFTGCDALETVTMSGNVSRIGMWAFEFCGSLTTVTLTRGNIAMPALLTARLIRSMEMLRSIRVTDGEQAAELLTEYPSGTRPHAPLMSGLLELAQEDPSILRSEFLLKGPLFEELLAYTQEHMPPLAAELLRARHEIVPVEEDNFTL